MIRRTICLVCLALCLLACDKQARIDALIKDVLTDDSINGTRAAVKLVELGPPATDQAVAAIVKALQNDQLTSASRTFLIIKFSTFGSLARDAVPTLLDIVENTEEHWITRTMAVDVLLDNIQPDYKDLEKRLLPLISDKREHRSIRYGILLSYKGPAILPILIAILQDPESEWRVDAAFLLGEFRPVAKQALPALREAKRLEEAKRDQADPKIIWEIGIAISKIERPSPVPQTGDEPN